MRDKLGRRLLPSFCPIFCAKTTRALQIQYLAMPNKQSAKKRQMSVAVRKELLSLRHRFGERTSCEGRLTTQFRLVNSGKILSRDERRQMPTPYCYRAWTAFPHFLIRFTRADQRNERSWDTLFLYALSVVPLRVIARNEAI